MRWQNSRSYMQDKQPLVIDSQKQKNSCLPDCVSCTEANFQFVEVMNGFGSRLNNYV